MQFRRFNDRGIEVFRSLLMEMRQNPKAPFPKSILTDESLSQVLEPKISAPVEEFANRMAFARWLSSAAESCQAQPPRTDVGFWTWLTAALFDQVCPADGHGKRKVFAEARYIPDLTRYSRSYRHLLANPFHVYQLHHEDPSRAIVALINPLQTPGELTEQFASRIELIACPGAMSVARALYIDPETGERRRGASGDSAGRLAKVMNQYARTWDIPVVDSAEFTHMLPAEFNRFKPTLDADSESI